MIATRPATAARQPPRPSDRTRLRDAVLDAANVVDCALDCGEYEATSMLVELVDRLELVLDEIPA